MYQYKIVTDSTADLPVEYLEKHQIGCLNLSYIIEDKIYGQGQELEIEDFYNVMRKGKMPSTSQVNPDEAKAKFEEFYQTDKNILYLAFSSGLSGTYNSGCIAANEMMTEHPDCKIVVIDTLCASMGEALIVHKAVTLREQGKSIDEVAEWVSGNKLKVVHAITVDDLNHLYRGGRLSKAAAVVGTMVSVKPQLHVNDEGKLAVLGKNRGRKKSLDALIDYLEEKGARGVAEEVFIIHGDCIEDTEYVKEQIEKRLNIQNFMVNFAGPIIGSHTGPGVIGLFCMGESR
ncbi:MAG: DegV family protein [Lachnospiraceae bacterium]|nr:DegV family protein [Lachnospiraceae bacterium]